MIQSWSSSYSYSNDGKNEQVSYENKYNDNKNQYSTGMRRKKNRRTQEKDEIFYRTKQNDNTRRDILGKSKNNQSWNIEKRQDGMTKMKETLGYDKYGGYFNYLDKVGKPQLVQHQLTNYPNMYAGSQSLIHPNRRRVPQNNVTYQREGFKNKIDQMFNDPFFKN